MRMACSLNLAASLALLLGSCRIENDRLELLPAGDWLYQLDDGDGFTSWVFGLALAPEPIDLSTAELSIRRLRGGELVGEERYTGAALAAHLGPARGVSDQPALVDLSGRAPRNLEVDALELILRRGRRRGERRLPLVTYTPQNRLRLPLEGCWLVSNGHHGLDEHRRWYNRAHFAIDLVQVNARGEPHDGGGALGDYYAYGAPVIAPAAGLVRLARDDFPDATPGEPRPAAETNFILLEHAGGEQTKFAHLQPGSLAVHPGERVVTGQLLARVGNSGASDAPHLHLHLQRATVDAEGVILAEHPLPLTLSGYRLHNHRGASQRVDAGTPRRGDFVCAD